MNQPVGFESLSYVVEFIRGISKTSVYFNKSMLTINSKYAIMSLQASLLSERWF